MKKLFIFLFIFLNIVNYSKSDDFFEDITYQILENQPRLSYGVSVSDVNYDGNFEFIVTGFGFNNLALTNKKGILFNSIDQSLFLDKNRKTIGVAACDIDQDGYEEPVDSDNNGVLDCYDALVLVIDIDSQPQYAGTVFQGDDVSYAIGVNVDGDLPAEYLWQRGDVSEDEQDTTWTDLANGIQYSGVDTDSMTITNVTFDEFDNTLYRVLVTAKGYKCALVPSELVVLDVKFRDLHVPQGISPNKDKINDPIEPDIVLFGLIFVNFFPLKILPKINPPMSEQIHIENK